MDTVQKACRYSVPLAEDPRKRFTVRWTEERRERYLAHASHALATIRAAYGDRWDSIVAASGGGTEYPPPGHLFGRSDARPGSKARTAADGQWRRVAEAPARALGRRATAAARLLDDLAACPWPMAEHYPTPPSEAELDDDRRAWWEVWAARFATMSPADDASFRALVRRDLADSEETSDAIALLWQAAARWCALSPEERATVRLERYRTDTGRRVRGAAITDPVRFVRAVARKLAQGHDGRSPVDARAPRMELRDDIGALAAPVEELRYRATGPDLAALAMTLPPGRQDAFIQAARKRLAPRDPSTKERQRPTARRLGVRLTSSEVQALRMARAVLADGARARIAARLALFDEK